MDLLGDLPDGTERDQAPFLDDPDRGADVGQLGEDVRRKENGLAGFAKPEEQIAHLDARPRIEVAGRFVEDQHLGVVEDGLRELEALAHSLGERSGQLPSRLRERGELERSLDRRGGVEPMGGGDEREVFLDGELGVNARLVGHVADDGPHALGFETDVEAADLDATGPGVEQRGHGPDRRRLARTVRTDETEDLPALHFEADVVEHLGRSETVRQVVRRDDGRADLHDGLIALLAGNSRTDRCPECGPTAPIR